MNILKAIRICKDIESLHKNGGKERIYHRNCIYWPPRYSIDILGDKSKITATRHEESISEETVPFNFWTCLTGNYGYHKTVPLYFDVVINNNGFFTNIPKGDNFTFQGLAARIVYNKMRKEYALAVQHGPDIPPCR
jgi:hypothetical protein